MDTEELTLDPRKRSPLKRSPTKKLSPEQIEERRAESSAKLVEAAKAGKCGDMQRLLGSATLSAAERKERQKQGAVDADANALVPPPKLREGWARTPLLEAVFHNQLEAVVLLLESRADPSLADGSTWTPLIAAAEQGLLPVMRKLIQAGAALGLDRSWLDALDEDIGCTAFHYAGIMGHRDCTDALLRAGCSAEMQSEDGTEGLELAKMVCARAGRRGRSNALAREAKAKKASAVGAEDAVAVDREVLYMDDEGKWQVGTKVQLGYEENLHAAAITGDLPMLQRLLMVADEKGIDINELDQHGQTPLYLAVCAGQLKMAQILLINHANPYIKGTNGSAPIHGAARHGQSDCVEMLLERKADVNVRGVHGRTPLILAASSGYVTTVRMLLQHGADPHQTDNDSRSAVDLAANLHIIHLLRRTLEERGSRHGRYEVAESSGRPDDKSNELGSCEGVCEGTKAIDTATGEHVVILRFTDAAPCERMRTAIRALHGTFAGGFGALNTAPPPYVPPTEGDAEEEEPTEPTMTLHLSSSSEDEDEGGDGDGDEDEDTESNGGKNDDDNDDPVPEEEPAAAAAAAAAPQPEPKPEANHVLVVQAWSTTLGDYAHAARNAMPLAEIRAVLRSLLYAVSALHSASLAHGAVGLRTVVRYWDGSWRLVDLHRVRHQGMNSDPALIVHAEQEVDAQAAAADDPESAGNGKQRANFGALLARERERNNGGPVIPLKLPSIPPEGVRRARAEADMWAVGVLALALLTRSGRKHALPCGRAATPEAYWEALNEWMRPQLHGKGDPIILSVDAEELIEGLVSYDPAARLTAEEALELPFFRQAHAVPMPHDFDRVQAGGEPFVPAELPQQDPKEFQQLQRDQEAAAAAEGAAAGAAEQQAHGDTGTDGGGGGENAEGDDDEAMAEEQAWREQLESVRVLVAQRSRARTIRRKRKIILRDDADSFGELRFPGETDSDDDGDGKGGGAAAMGMGLLGVRAKVNQFKKNDQGSSSSEESSDDDQPLPEENTDEDASDDDELTRMNAASNAAASAAVALAAAVDGDGSGSGNASGEGGENTDSKDKRGQGGEGDSNRFRNLLPGKKSLPTVSVPSGLSGIGGLLGGNGKFSYTDEELANDAIKHHWIAKQKPKTLKASKGGKGGKNKSAAAAAAGGDAEYEDEYEYYSSDDESEFEIAFNEEALQQVLARRIEREAVGRYASMAGISREEMLVWLRQKHVRWITKLPDDEREALIDELRRGVDRRWQYQENKYGAPPDPVTKLNKSALRLGKLYAMSEKLRLVTPRLFAVLPSRTAIKLDSVAPRWLEPKRWNAGSFALHPMCEWDGGHFLPSRYAYPIPDPQRVLRDCGPILHYNMELVQAALEAIEESPYATSSNFVIPYAKIRKEGEALRKRASSSKSKDKEGGGGGGGGATSPSARRPIRDVEEATHNEDNHPFLFRFMSEVIEKAKKKALAGSAASAEAARAAANYGTSLCHLERFLLASDPLGDFGGLYLCEPPHEKHPDRPTSVPPHRCWLCPQHAQELSNAGGSVSLGRTPPWTTGGLLYGLANQPYLAPTQPFAPAEVISKTMDSAEPPALDYSDDGPKGESDRAAAKKRLRKLPEPKKPEPELLPAVAAVVLEVQKVEEAVVLLREDKPGHAIVVVYVSPLGVQRPTVGAQCMARVEKRYHPAAVVVLPDFPRDAKGAVDIKRLQPPSPNDWLPSVKLKQQQRAGRGGAGAGGGPDDEAPPDAAAVLKGLGDPKAYAEKLAKPPSSSACLLQ